MVIYCTKSSKHGKNFRVRIRVSQIEDFGVLYSFSSLRALKGLRGRIGVFVFKTPEKTVSSNNKID